MTNRVCTRKLDFYRAFSTVEVILYIWQDKRRVEFHTRESDGWKVRDFVGSGTVPLDLFDIGLDLDAIYADLS